MKQFQELHQAVTNDRKYSPWSKQQTIPARVKILHEEMQELLEAVQKEDIENLREELGDIIWDAVAIAVIAEEKKLFTTQEVLQNVITKFKQRKPFIFTEEEISPEEERKHYLEAKKKARSQ